MHAGHGDMRRILRAKHDYALVFVAQRRESQVGGRTVRAHRGRCIRTSGINGITLAALSSRIRRSRIRFKPLDSQNFHRDDKEDLGCVALAPFSRGWRLPVCEGQMGLINLDQPMPLLAFGRHHGTPKAMKHGPCGLVTSQANHPLVTRADSAAPRWKR